MCIRDSFKNVLDELKVSLEKVVVTELHDKTFFAELHMRRDADGSQFTISSRPSDAIALAVRSEAPIFAAESVLDEAAVTLEESGEQNQEQVVEEFREFIETVNPEDFA